MLEPGDLVIIKKVDEPWVRMLNQIAIFVGYETDNEVLSHIIRPIHSELDLKFAAEDLELLCKAQEVKRIWKEEFGAY